MRTLVCRFLEELQHATCAVVELEDAAALYALLVAQVVVARHISVYPACELVSMHLLLYACLHAHLWT